MPLIIYTSMEILMKEKKWKANPMWEKQVIMFNRRLLSLLNIENVFPLILLN